MSHLFYCYQIKLIENIFDSKQDRPSLQELLSNAIAKTHYILNAII